MFYSLPLQLILKATGLNSLNYGARSWFLVLFFINLIRLAWKAFNNKCFNCNAVCSFKSKFKTVNFMKFMNSNV